MSTSLKYLAISLSLGMVLFAGCSDEEAAKKIEIETEQVKDSAKQATDEVRQELPGIIQNMKEFYNESEKELKENTLQTGDSAKVKKDAYVALSPEAYEELYRLIEINDLDGVENIEKTNKIILIKEGSEVEILDRDIRRTKVKIKDSGEEGYLPTNLMDPIN